MRPRLLLLLLALPAGVAFGQARTPARVCVWEGGRFAWATAYHDRAANALFTATAGPERFADRHPSDSTAGYARTTGWYRQDDVVTVGGAPFASYRSAGTMDETGLVLAGTFGGVPFFRRAANPSADALYALVGPGFRTSGPAVLAGEGRCEFQPYRRVSAPQ